MVEPKTEWTKGHKEVLAELNLHINDVKDLNEDLSDIYVINGIVQKGKEKGMMSTRHKV